MRLIQSKYFILLLFMMSSEILFAQQVDTLVPNPNELLLKNKIQQLDDSIHLLQNEYSTVKQYARSLNESLQKTDMNQASTLYQEAFSLFQQGNATQAINILDNQLLDTLLGSAKREKLNSETQLKKSNEAIQKCLDLYLLKAQLCLSSNQLKEAEANYEKAILLDSSVFVKLVYVGNQHLDNNQSDEAIRIYKRIIANYDSIHSTNQDYKPYVAMTLNNLGNIYTEQKKYDQALYCLERALFIKEEFLTIKPTQYKPDVARTLNNLGVLYKEMGSNEKAAEYYKRSLALYNELIVSQTVYESFTAETNNNLGLAYNELKKFKKAIPVFNKAIVLYKPLSEKRKDLAATYNNLGVAYDNLSKNKEALDAYQSAMRLYEGLYKQGAEQYLPTIARILNNISIIYKDLNDLPQALAACEKTVTYYQILAEKDHTTYDPSLATAYNGTGIVNKDMGDFQHALLYFQKAQTIREALASSNSTIYSVDLCNTLLNIAFVYSDLMIKERNSTNKQLGIIVVEKAITIINTLPDSPVSQHLSKKAKSLKEHFENSLAN